MPVVSRFRKYSLIQSLFGNRFFVRDDERKVRKRIGTPEAEVLHSAFREIEARELPKARKDLAREHTLLCLAKALFDPADGRAQLLMNSSSRHFIDKTLMNVAPPEETATTRTPGRTVLHDLGELVLAQDADQSLHVIIPGQNAEFPVDPEYRQYFDQTCEAMKKISFPSIDTDRRVAAFETLCTTIMFASTGDEHARGVIRKYDPSTIAMTLLLEHRG